MPPPRRNLTGFDPQKLAAASGQPANDPWARREAWRYQGHFTRWNRFRGALPGLGIGFGAFVVYSVFETLFLEDKHGHGQGHGEGDHEKEHH